MESSASVATSPGSRPFEPYVAGVNGLLFSPISGALFAFLNFRRLGKPEKAKKVIGYAIPAAVVEFFFLMQMPEQIARYAGIGIAVASYKIFTFIQESDLEEWEKQNPGIKPRGFWSGAGWSVLGIAASLAIAFPLAYLLD
jgi:hypothetical protein